MASRTLLAWCNIVLILSLHPIVALRTVELDAVTNRVEEAASVVTELQRAMQEATQEEIDGAGSAEEQDYWGESWAKCPQIKDDFERRSGKVHARLTVSLEDGDVSMIEASWVLLKVHKTVKTLKRAMHKKCDWVHEGRVNTSALDAVTKTIGKMNPCLDKAKALAKEAMAGDEKAKRHGAMKAFGVLFSKTCEPPSTEELEGSGASTEDSEAGADEAAGALADTLNKQAKSGSLLQAAESGQLQLNATWSAGGKFLALTGIFLIVALLTASLGCFVLVAAYFMMLLPIYMVLLCLISKVIYLILGMFNYKPPSVNFVTCMADVWMTSIPLAGVLCALGALGVL